MASVDGRGYFGQASVLSFGLIFLIFRQGVSAVGRKFPIGFVSPSDIENSPYHPRHADFSAETYPCSLDLRSLFLEPAAVPFRLAESGTPAVAQIDGLSEEFAPAARTADRFIHFEDFLYVASTVVDKEKFKEEEMQSLLTQGKEEIYFAELIGNNVEGWQPMLGPPEAGRWSTEEPLSSGIKGDKFLVAKGSNKRHVIAKKFQRPIKPNPAQPFILQFEAMFQRGLFCAGAMIQLFDSTLQEIPDNEGENKGVQDDKDDQSFESFGKYDNSILTFGPDQCNNKAAVKFTIVTKNPITHKLTRHVLRKRVGFADSKTTQWFQLRIENGVGEVRVNDDSKVEFGAEDFDPPIIPPRLIPDSTAKKPSDWDDRERLYDETVKRPDYWVVERYLKDTDAEMPEGWLVDEPKVIPRPKHWDPVYQPQEFIRNPKCTVGCGPWEPPLKNNPAYIGQWLPPSVPNPNYKGKWKIPMIPNPDYYEASLSDVLEFNGIGMDVWTERGGVSFKNIISLSSVSKAANFKDTAFKRRRRQEENIELLAISLANMYYTDCKISQSNKLSWFQKYFVWTMALWEKHKVTIAKGLLILGGSIYVISVLWEMIRRLREEKRKEE